MSSKAQTTISVKLLGQLLELAAASTIQAKVRGQTPREIINEIAHANPLIAESIVREDGNPRLSTKILINGRPPKSLDERIPTLSEATISLIVLTGCDG
jgi:hypothetical protein